MSEREGPGNLALRALPCRSRPCVRPRRRRRPRGRRLQRCPLRHPGRRLARPRAWRSRTDRLDRLELLGVDLVRFNLHWDQIEATRGQPAWEDSDAVLEGLHARGIAAVVGLVGSPRWANGGRTPNFAPGAASFGAFARAAATRYRWVREWLIWNEPNQARWLRPTTAAVYVRQILNPAYARHPLGHPARQGGRRRHGAARLGRRRLSGRLDPRDARAPGPASTPTRTTRIRRAPARRRSRAGAATARRSRWRRSSGSSPRSTARSGRSGSG